MDLKLPFDTRVPLFMATGSSEERSGLSQAEATLLARRIVTRSDMAKLGRVTDEEQPFLG